MILVLLNVLLCGCFRLGPTRLDEDQLGFSRALSESEKRQTLLNVVRLRYADMPTFLEATQVISGYQLQQNITGGVEVFPSAPTSLSLGQQLGTAATKPHLHLRAGCGNRFAQNFLRALSPADLLSLAQGGLPVDLLFRLAVQSVGSLENATVLEKTGSEGSPEFFLLLHDLRRLQVAGLLGVKLQRPSKAASDNKPAFPEHVFVTVTSTKEPARAAVEAETRRRLVS